jgi:sulfur relay protein TusB/DsrH
MLSILKVRRKMEELDILYLFGFSEVVGNQMKKLLPLITTQVRKSDRVGVALIHDGVIGYNKKGKIPLANQDLLNLGVPVFALTPDLKARGISLEDLHEKVKLMEYGELVDLLENSKKIISWT